MSQPSSIALHQQRSQVLKHKTTIHHLSTIFALMKKLFKTILDWLRYRHMYVIADATDNSVTFSRALFHHMGGLSLEQAKVFAFYVPHQGHYGFILNPEFDQETQLADIQYNTKHRTIGFEMLNPTVNRMFYDYGLRPMTKVKLSVKHKRLHGITYYQICPPK